MPSWTGNLIQHERLPLTVSTSDDIDALLIVAARLGASEIIFQTGRPVLTQIHGAWSALTPTWLQTAAVEHVCVHVSAKASVVSRLYSGLDFDTALTVHDHQTRSDEGEPLAYRFRINLTAGHYETGNGIQVVCRSIPTEPPTVEAIELEPEIVAASTPANGAVIVSGAVGSGKSTTLAALLRRIVEGRTSVAGNVVTYESPIEYLFDRISSPACTISQHEIGRHLPTFAEAVRNSLRRYPALLQIGELRDAETILAAIEAANVGTPFFSTVHSNDTAHIMRRMMMVFPQDAQFRAFHDILDMSRLLISQVLVPRIGGGRICLREWLLVTDDDRRQIARAGIDGCAEEMRRIMQAGHSGRSMSETIRRALDRGAISIRTASSVLRQYGYREESDALAA